jgi:hypothetical protein
MFLAIGENLTPYLEKDIRKSKEKLHIEIEFAYSTSSLYDIYAYYEFLFYNSYVGFTIISASKISKTRFGFLAYL